MKIESYAAYVNGLDFRGYDGQQKIKEIAGDHIEAIHLSDIEPSKWDKHDKRERATNRFMIRAKTLEELQEALKKLS